ncbi:MAG: hypothetical protein A2746_02430 [Candidatus Yanofskybacteria bacterium RIFCSPHIGHO2_01_FULL_44_22]|uniref:GIY-YIG domain-containing protein n=1 Tax=Candidatus Yanofskybacteria bacterium RIFCSPHIGHO2_01_FULL_44_22 TaxID=1802669 RepID=A0A1F8EYJ3_9BACT|nr:MAG: hypothetical protein A2746_02430 [Candidatus Yanofskybacteria bacterium RIFCSPHIGHO2_01_FULL_44_22]
MPFVYMIKNLRGCLYIGIAQNPKQRLRHHNTQHGALFTKSSNSFAIVFQEKYESLSDARKREIQIKKWRRQKKEKLIEKFQKGLSTKF